MNKFSNFWTMCWFVRLFHDDTRSLVVNAALTLMLLTQKNKKEHVQKTLSPFKKLLAFKRKDFSNYSTYLSWIRVLPVKFFNNNNSIAYNIGILQNSSWNSNHKSSRLCLSFMSFSKWFLLIFKDVLFSKSFHCKFWSLLSISASV